MIFINYRQNRYVDDLPVRRPHAQLVEALAERLGTHFGAVFLDTGIRPASRYPDELRGHLLRSSLLIVMIHDQWLEDLNGRKGQQDWVHYEIATALAGGIHVLPVLIDGAGLPGHDKLPEDIRGLASSQAIRLQFGHWRRDVELLIKAAEVYVSPQPVLPAHRRERSVRTATAAELSVSHGKLKAGDPPGGDPRGSVGRRRAGALGAIVAALAGVLAPFALTGVWPIVIAIVLLIGLFVVAATVSVVNGSRGWLDGLDHEAAIMPRDLKANVIIGLAVAGLGTIQLFTGNLLTPQQQLLSFAVLVGIVITLGAQWVRTQRAAIAWPQPHLAADPASVRGAVAMVDRHLTACAPLMSRHQRDVARFAIDQIEETAQRLRELGGQTRREWLRAAQPWLPLLHLLLLAATTGCALASGNPWVLVCVPLAATLYLAAIDQSYRLQRWRRQVVVEAIPPVLARLEARLAEISIPDPKATS